MRKASAADLGRLPTSLMHRLALLEQGVLRVPRPGAGAQGAHPAGSPSRPRRFGASFACGLACGGLLGSAVLLALLTPAWTKQAPLRGDVTLRLSADAAPADLELAVRPGRDGSAPFPLHVTGADAVDSVRLVLRDLPEPVLLSRGERRDEHTWDLRLADLEGLSLTLGEGTPHAFDVAIEVAPGAGPPLARAVAHVRLEDRDPAAPRPTGSAAARIAHPLRAAPAPPQAAPRMALERAPAVRELAAGVLPRPVLPDGASTLGGPRGDSAPAESVEGRKVWWRLPAAAAPAWTPFTSTTSGN